MKARHALIVAVCGLALNGIAWGTGKGDKTPTPPPSAPPPAPRQTSTPAPHTETPSKTSSTSTQNSTSSSKSGDSTRRSGDRRPYNYNYGRSGYYQPNYQGNNNNNNRSSSNSSTTAPYTSSDNAPFTSATPTLQPIPTTDSPTTQPTSDSELASATAEYEAALSQVKATRDELPEYKAALAEKKTAQEGVAALQEKPDASIAERINVAQRNLAANKRLAKIEQDATARDERLKAARARLDAVLAARGNAGNPPAAAPAPPPDAAPFTK